MKIDYHTPFYTNQFYHIYNRGNNGEIIFYNSENYNFFLRRFDEYLSACADTFAYCLLPNHFHLLIKVKDNNKISEQIRLFFLSYSKAINKQNSRTGSLFQKRFKRKIIEDRTSLCKTVLYIHANPLHHRITQDFVNYNYSSYKSLISDKRTKLSREEVFKWFSGQDQFIEQYKERMINFTDEPYLYEDKD